MSGQAGLAMSDASMKRTVWLLASGLSLSQMGSVMVIIVTSLAGTILMPDGNFPTLALTLQFLGTMLSTIPANMIMRRIGRKAGFTIGQIVGILGAALSAYAIMEGSFELFCAGGFLLGINNAVWFYFRFAASEVATDAYRSKAISYVMTGGVIAAIFGAEIAKLTETALAPYTYAGCYAAIIVLCLITIAILQFIDIPGLSEEEKKDTGRPLIEIIKQPLFVSAVVAAMIGYGAMSLIMTATPLAMVACGFEFDDSAFAIQWHAVAMYAPSFFTGGLIKRYGVIRIIFIGIACMFATIGINLSGIEMLNFVSSLVLLGIGWNFMFVGGTALLTESYTNSERNKVQGFNDFLVFGTVASTSLTAGYLQQAIGWDAVNIAVIVPLGIATIAVALSVKAHKKYARSHAVEDA
ncbi:MFS transporter [Curvivirga aplysinae]|uniref:MFS transporter n=1 Tax=Curvivirga aplysinae TaxID=2529852 RepID=UPI001F3BD4A8|nr:MFS transporter [Curvivirga aplysinae]